MLARSDCLAKCCVIQARRLEKHCDLIDDVVTVVEHVDDYIGLFDEYQSAVERLAAGKVFSNSPRE